jgi:SAM-dependent methyltransferase
VTGFLPDAASLERAWALRVQANREQVERFREAPEGPDFYAPTSSLFRADPFRTDDPVLEALVALAEPGETWLDIGAGAGRFALPLARAVREVIALDPSPGMLEGLRAGMAEGRISTIRVIEGRWPAAADALRCDVALIAHVGYDVEDIGSFLDAMELAAGRLCIAVLMDRAPASAADPFWPPIHGQERVPLPALPELLALLLARGRPFELRRIPGEVRRFASVDEAMGFLRQQLWVAPGSAKEGRLRELADALARDDQGGVRLAARHRDIGIVSWRRRATDGPPGWR